MPLTLRTAGSLVTVAFFNDFYNLLTGVIQDQPVKIQNTLTLQAYVPIGPSAPSAALASGTALGIGSYTYSVSFLTANGQGETTVSSSTAINTLSTQQAVNLSGIPIGGTGTTQRNIYRSKVGGGQQYLCHIIADNTTTTYSDVIGDSSLSTTVLAPVYKNTIGGLVINAYGGGTQVAWIDSLGTVYGTNVVSAISGSGYSFGSVGGAVAPYPALDMDTFGAVKVLGAATGGSGANYVKISKSGSAYDAAVFNMAGASAIITLTGALTLTGAATISGATTVNNSMTVNGAFTSTGTNNLTGTLNVLNGDVQIGSSGHAQKIFFNAGNNGQISNPSGGALNLTSGGSGFINFSIGGNTPVLKAYIDQHGCYTGQENLSGIQYYNYGNTVQSTHAHLTKDFTAPASGPVNHTLGCTPYALMVQGIESSATQCYFNISTITNAQVQVQTGGTQGGLARLILFG